MKILEITDKNKTISKIINLDVDLLYHRLKDILRSEQHIKIYKSNKTLEICIKLYTDIRAVLESNQFDPNDYELNQSKQNLKELLPDLKNLINDIK